MLIIKSFIFNPVQENTYVLSDEKDACCIIDPGCYFPAEKTQLQEYVEQQGLTPQLLLNTHCHLDHVFGNKFVHDTWSLPLHLNAKEKPVLDAGPAMGLNWGLPYENYRGPLIWLEEGQRISLGENELKVLFLPGHAPGHVGFYCEKQGFVIGGDVLFRGSIGRTDLPGGDFGTLIRSIKDQLWVLPDEVVVYPGHGEPTTIGYEKRHNPFLKD
jgi:hydroxyacylglutathione hydrolase